MLKFTKTSTSLELEGAPAEYDDGLGNILHMKVARIDNNPHYDATLLRLMEPYRKQQKQGREVSNEVAKRVLIRTYAKEILLGWDSKDLTDDEGKLVKYSEDRAIDLLTADGDLYDFVFKFATDMNNYLKVEDVAGK